MFGALLKGLFWFVAMMIAFAILVTHAQAQPPTYLPWQYGATYRVIQGNNGGYSHNTQYTRYGWDFNLPSGTPVVSAAPGRVSIASGGWNGGWGNTVTVCYGDGTCSRYGHLSSLAVGRGQSVGQAQLIGRSGTTGSSSGPHLHYQLENGNGISLPSRFVEAGVPGRGQSVTSRNRGGEYRGTLNAQFPMDGNGVVAISQGDGAKVPIGYNLWNNGTRVWGDARLVLVSDPPQNLRRALGWESLNSIPGDRQRVEPGTGTNVRFHVNPEEINPPGDYRFQFRVLDRATGEFIPGVLPSFVLRVKPACYTAAFAGQSVSPLTAPGGSGQLEVSLRNTGTCTWYSNGANPVRLGTQNPRDLPFRFADAGWLSPNRVALAEQSVAPGQVGHFRATFTVPAGIPAGRGVQYFAPVVEGRQWFGLQLGVFLAFQVGDRYHLPFTAGEYAAKWITQTYLGPLQWGGTGEVKVTYRNIGEAVLFPDGAAPVNLRGSHPRNRESGFVDRTSQRAVGSNQAQGVRLDQDRVNPGELFSFTMPVRVMNGLPSGMYPEYFQPVAEGLTWFGPDDVWWPFTVK
ncbi:hypothetical protein EXS54_00580 [Patescibacteria group bacterium]|nr:hypothetical protein [Patescibacteria group bacterium]